MVQVEMPPAVVPPAEQEYAIRVDGMKKRYGRTQAVRNLSMHVPRGSVYGFVGPNGAGKTTTIRTLATLQRADQGTVEVAGIDVRKDPGAVRDRIGYMPDFFGVYESLTVSEYLDFYGASHNIPSARRRRLSAELLELVDLTDKRNESVEVLSRGMKQRLGLARCLVHDPEVLLLDEPASGMDPRARIELRDILRELSRMNKTILISSHILPELAELCTSIGIILAGELIAEGPVQGVIAALTSGGRLRIRALASGAGTGTSESRLLHVLEETPCCSDIEVAADGSVRATFTGGEADRAALLASLVAAGIPVTDFSHEGGSLEDVFLTITDRAGPEAAASPEAGRPGPMEAAS